MAEGKLQVVSTCKRLTGKIELIKTKLPPSKQKTKQNTGMKKRAISAKGQQHVDVCVQTLKTVDARSCGQFSKAGGVQVSCVS